MKQRGYSHLQLGIVLGTGALLAAVVCVQGLRTYLYTDAVLVPRQAEREAERQMAAFNVAIQSAGITNPRALGPVIEHSLEFATDRVLWMRVLDPESNIVAQGGEPRGTPQVPLRWWETHDSLGSVVDTPGGEVFVAMLPFRMAATDSVGGRHAGEYVLELAIPTKASSGMFSGLRQNLILGLMASIAMLVSIAVIALCAPRHLRGVSLQRELQLARLVQRDLQPKPDLTSPCVEFSAAAVPAGDVGRDFHDVFETASGKIAIVIGDVSGTGVPAALLASVLHGAIRSSAAPRHEDACERINRMLCDLSGGQQFATLFWAVFDPAGGTMRYVNAGHVAPMLIRHGPRRIELLDQGEPALGLIPTARYTVGIVEIDVSDTLILYSDGIGEVRNGDGEEFEDRIPQLTWDAQDLEPAGLCAQIMERAGAFESHGAPADDRTLIVVRFPLSSAALTA